MKVYRKTVNADRVEALVRYASIGLMTQKPKNAELTLELVNVNGRVISLKMYYSADTDAVTISVNDSSGVRGLDLQFDTSGPLVMELCAMIYALLKEAKLLGNVKLIYWQAKNNKVTEYVDGAAQEVHAK